MVSKWDVNEIKYIYTARMTPELLKRWAFHFWAHLWKVLLRKTVYSPGHTDVYGTQTEPELLRSGSATGGDSPGVRAWCIRSTQHGTTMLRYIKDTMLHYIKLTPGIRRQSGGLRALLSGGGGSSPPRWPRPQMPINYTTALAHNSLVYIIQKHTSWNKVFKNPDQAQ